MLRWIIIWNLLGCFYSTFAQSNQQKKVDSVRVIIALTASTSQLELSEGYWESRANLEVLMDLYSFAGGKHVSQTFQLNYDEDEDAWIGNLPKGFYDLRVESLGFSKIVYTIHLEKDHREELLLEANSIPYTYKNRKRYNYIAGTLNFNETIIVKFIDGNPADNMDFLRTALAIEGMEHLSVWRIQKIRYANSYLVTLDIADQTELNVILYRKVTNAPEIERGYLIGADVTKALELFQANPNVEYANPSFLDDPQAVFLPSAEYTQSEGLERKLLGLMEEDSQTLNKINYIIKKTTPTKVSSEDIE